ncbi:thymidylate synthase [Shewanella sp. SR43-4]|nr:thymidylate synthase [Shewanella sp. SR43-4]
MHDVYCYVLKNGKENIATKGENIELLGCELILKNPVARISRSESRGLIFSCLGELFWYLSGKNDSDHISAYIPKYKDYAELDGSIHGGYGNRFFNMHQKYDQIQKIIEQLKEKSGTRRAVIQLFDSSDLSIDYKDIPCTLNLQFIIRENKLHLFTMMRSNDAYVGLPHDIFVFTMMQELISKEVNCKLGSYHHYVVSLHVYNKDIDNVKRFVEEGYMTTKCIMENMPSSEFFASKNILIDCEKKIRENVEFDINLLEISSYWKDILRLLQFFILTKDQSDLRKAIVVKNSISNENYKILIQKRERKIF